MTATEPFWYSVEAEFCCNHLPTLHWFAPDYELVTGVRQLQLPHRDAFSGLYGKAKDGERWMFVKSRLIQLISISAVAYCGQSGGAGDQMAAAKAHMAEMQAAAKSHVHGAAGDAADAAHGHGMAAAQAGYDAVFTPEVQQALALFGGSFMLFYMAAQVDLGEKFKEMKKRQKSQGRAREGIKWWLRKENRYWWMRAIIWGECFVGFMQCVLLVFVIQLLMAKGGAFEARTASGYTCIVVVSLTIFGMNLQFILEQMKVLAREIPTIPEKVNNKITGVIDAIDQAQRVFKEKVEETIEDIKGKWEELLNLPNTYKEKWEDFQETMYEKKEHLEVQFHQLKVAIMELLSGKKKVFLSPFRAKASKHAKAIVGEDAKDSEIVYHDILERGQVHRQEQTFIQKVLKKHTKSMRDYSELQQNDQQALEMNNLANDVDTVNEVADERPVHHIVREQVHEAKVELMAPWARGHLEDQDILDEDIRKQIAVALAEAKLAHTGHGHHDYQDFDQREGTVFGMSFIIDEIGLELHASVKPLHHEKNLRKKLLRPKQGLRASRNILSELPVQLDYCTFISGKPDPERAVLVATIQVVNFHTGFAAANQPSNDAILSLWTAETLGKGERRSQLADWYLEVVGWFNSKYGDQHAVATLRPVVEALFWSTRQEGSPADPENQDDLLAQHALIIGEYGDPSEEIREFLMNGSPVKQDSPEYQDWVQGRLEVKQQFKGEVFPGFAELLTGTKGGELVDYLATPKSSPLVIHLVIEEKGSAHIMNWNPSPTCASPAEYFESPSSSGQLCQLRLVGNRIEWITPPDTGGEDEEGLTKSEAAQNLAAALKDCTDCIMLDETDTIEVRPNAQQLIIHRPGGAEDTIFCMSKLEIREWAEIVRIYAMDHKKQLLMGYRGGLQDHPHLSSVNVRHGDDGEQIWYQPTVIKPLPHFVEPEDSEKDHKAGITVSIEKTLFSGCFDKHRYHRDGQIRRVQYSLCDSLSGSPDDWVNPWEVNEDPKFQQEVLVYDGHFHDGRRHGKGTLIAEVPRGTWYRFTGVWLHDLPIFGELERIHTVRGDHTLYYCGAYKHRDELTGEAWNNWPSGMITKLSGFEIFSALTAFAMEYDGGRGPLAAFVDPPSDELGGRAKLPTPGEVLERLRAIHREIEEKAKLAAAAEAAQLKKGATKDMHRGSTKDVHRGSTKDIHKSSTTEIHKDSKGGTQENLQTPRSGTRDSPRSHSPRPHVHHDENKDVAKEYNKKFKQKKIDRFITPFEAFCISKLQNSIAKGWVPSASMLFYVSEEQEPNDPAVEQRLPPSEALPLNPESGWPMLNSQNSATGKEQWKERQLFSSNVFKTWYHYDLPLPAAGFAMRAHCAQTHQDRPQGAPRDREEFELKTVKVEEPDGNPSAHEIAEHKKQRKFFGDLARDYDAVCNAYGHSTGLGPAHGVNLDATLQGKGQGLERKKMPEDSKLQGEHGFPRVQAKVSLWHRTQGIKIVDSGAVLQDTNSEEELWGLYRWEDDLLLQCGEDIIPDLVQDITFFGYISVDAGDDGCFEGYTAENCQMGEELADDGADHAFEDPKGRWKYIGLPQRLQKASADYGRLEIYDQHLAAGYFIEWQKARDSPDVPCIEDVKLLKVPEEGDFTLSDNALFFSAQGRTLRYEGETTVEKDEFHLHGQGELRFFNDKAGRFHDRPLLFEGTFEHHNFKHGTMILTGNGGLGGIYEGEFENGKRHGNGKFVFADAPNSRKPSDAFSVSYEGEWKEDVPDGNGIIRSGDGFSKVLVHEGKVIKARCFWAKGTLSKSLSSISPTPTLQPQKKMATLTCQLPPEDQPWEEGQPAQDSFLGPWIRDMTKTVATTPATEPTHLHQPHSPRAKDAIQEAGTSPGSRSSPEVLRGDEREMKDLGALLDIQGCPSPPRMSPGSPDREPSASAAQKEFSAAEEAAESTPAAVVIESQ
eukprot:gnl/MRDRNA2_/MRDRNA2_33666_c0_seq1.p1 gnl/MRDRNA2_/MRDRNA2_33666_c0~~gnl/MRDRNA2_/MRDRNA2_33666_c0_seq1.p1  ORF type:complete len:2255 (+),score=457.75 gnl/MRDRNA2_/MRDRNA2_33666_c0_seq1:952-6765(+)